MSGTSESEGSFGSSTEQHVTGYEETGAFTTDAEPVAETPSHGSSNEGINKTGANRPRDDEDQPGGA